MYWKSIYFPCEFMRRNYMYETIFYFGSQKEYFHNPPRVILRKFNNIFIMNTSDTEIYQFEGNSFRVFLSFDSIKNLYQLIILKSLIKRAQTKQILILVNFILKNIKS